jgi:hypothetical protein
MQWVADSGVRPRPWEIVVARCTDASGDAIEMEAYLDGTTLANLGPKT